MFLEAQADRPTSGAIISGALAKRSRGKGQAVSSDDKAGQSADQLADALDAKAARLQARARRYREGAVGERATADVLDGRSGDGWLVLHDLAIAGSKANIDHIVVAPGGVFVVDSKNWSRAPKVRSGTLWVGKFPQRHELSTISWEVEQVDAALRAALGDRNLRVTGIVSLTGVAPNEEALTVGEITAVAVRNLVSHIARRPTVLNLEQVEIVANALDRSFDSRSGRRSSVVRPSAFPRPASEVPVKRTARAVPSSISPQSAVRRPPRHAPTISGRSRSRQGHRVLMMELAVPIVVILLALVGLHELPLLSRSLARTITPKGLGLSTAGSTPTTSTTLPPPASISPVWTCPSRLAGWTVTVSWPRGAAPSGSWLAQTAPSPAGPWTTKALGVAGAIVKISGIHPGTAQWFRAGEVSAMEILGRPTVEGELATPPGC